MILKRGGVLGEGQKSLTGTESELILQYVTTVASIRDRILDHLQSEKVILIWIYF